MFCGITLGCLTKTIADARVNVDGCGEIGYGQTEAHCQGRFLDDVGSSRTEHLYPEDFAAALFGGEQHAAQHFSHDMGQGPDLVTDGTIADA